MAIAKSVAAGAGLSSLAPQSSAFRSGAAAACGLGRALTALRPQTGNPAARSKSLLVRAKMPEPGWYGGAPTDRKIRRSWGGQPRQDPLESGEYLWDNKEEWKRVLDQELAEASPAAAPARDGSRDSQGSGFLSLGRSMALDSMDVDLTTELIKASAGAAAQAAALENPNGAQGSGIRWRAVSKPSAREMQKREKSKASGWQGAYGAEPEELSLEDQERKFQELKTSLQIYTLVLGAAFSASAALAYSPEVAASVAVGGVGSLLYVRMLTSSVESMGSASLGAAARGSLGQPRLLVPAVLVMAYNRWNAIIVPEYGIFELQLIPMLLGFFTYKAATLIRTFQDILVEDAAKPARGAGSELQVKEDA